MTLPVLLNLSGKRCLVVGGGAVGTRKARSLLNAGAEVLILSPSLKVPVADAQYIPEGYSHERLLELRPWLVVAATNDETVNHAICEDGQAIGILTESVDNPALGDIRPMIAETREGVTVAVSAGIPQFSRDLSQRFAEQLTPELLMLLRWLRTIRPLLKDYIPDQPTRAERWSAVFTASDTLLDQLRAGDEAAAQQALADIFGAWVKDQLSS